MRIKNSGVLSALIYIWWILAYMVLLGFLHPEHIGMAIVGGFLIILGGFITSEIMYKIYGS